MERASLSEKMNKKGRDKMFNEKRECKNWRENRET